MKKLTIEEAFRFVNENSSCELLSKEYISNSSPLMFKCECGNIFNTSFATFKGRTGRTPKRYCDACGISNRANKKSYTNEQIKSFVEDNTNGEYRLNCISWKDTSTGKKRFLNITHLSCGKTYEVELSNWNSGKRCRECSILYNAIKNRLSEKELKDKVESVEGYEFINSFTKEVEGVIHREKTYITIKHKQCGEVFVKSLGEWTTTPKCPICSSKYSASFLHCALSVLFMHYYSDCKNEYDIGFKGDKGGISRYDLFVPNFKGVDTIFEFQSRYHDDKEDFDRRKKEYAESKGYVLIALDHRSVDINKIVKEYFDLDSIPLWVYEEIEKFKI